MSLHESAIVSGGASGLGLATVQMLAERGYQVVAAALPTADRTALEQLGDAVTFVATDVTDSAQVKAAVAAAVELGTLRVAVSCAGIPDNRRVIGSRGPLPIEEFERVIRVNLVGTACLVIEAAAAMSRNASPGDDANGLIVLTASIAAFDSGGSFAYSASKAGVAGMTLPAAQSLAGHKIRVMTIAPGFFETPMLLGMPSTLQQLHGTYQFPSRFGQGHEYAQLVGSIIDNPMLNGECVRLDGAFRMRTPQS